MFGMEIELKRKCPHTLSVMKNSKQFACILSCWEHMFCIPSQWDEIKGKVRYFESILVRIKYN